MNDKLILVSAKITWANEFIDRLFRDLADIHLDDLTETEHKIFKEGQKLGILSLNEHHEIKHDNTKSVFLRD